MKTIDFWKKHKRKFNMTKENLQNTVTCTTISFIIWSKFNLFDDKFLKNLDAFQKNLETGLVVSSSPWKPVSIFWIYMLHECITWAGRLHTNLNGISQKGSAHNPLWGFLYLAFYHRAALHCSAFVSSQSDPRVLTLLPCQLQLQPMLYRFPTMFFNITKHAASHSPYFVFTTIRT